MQIRLTNVRLSFPHLFKPQDSKDGGEPKYTASFLIKKDEQAALIAEIQKAIMAVARAKWPNGIPNSVQGEKVCLRRGETKDYDGYDSSVMFLASSSPVRPTVINRDRTPLTAEDGKPYAGCYVNAIVQLWAQDNTYGKRVNASLKAVQFAQDGDPFGEKPITPDAFDDLDGGDKALNPSAPDPLDPGPDADTIPF